jgi:hypothetical protein
LKFYVHQILHLIIQYQRFYSNRVPNWRRINRKPRVDYSPILNVWIRTQVLSRFTVFGHRSLSMLIHRFLKSSIIQISCAIRSVSLFCFYDWRWLWSITIGSNYDS